MIDIEKPKIEIAEISEDNRYGKFICEPLERGYGTTFGNSLRRMRLRSLAGNSRNLRSRPYNRNTSRSLLCSSLSRRNR